MIPMTISDFEFKGHVSFQIPPFVPQPLLMTLPVCHIWGSHLSWEPSRSPECSIPVHVLSWSGSPCHHDPHPRSSTPLSGPHLWRELERTQVQCEPCGPGALASPRCVFSHVRVCGCAGQVLATQGAQPSLLLSRGVPSSPVSAAASFPVWGPISRLGCARP